MDIGIIFEWFAQDSMLAAGMATDPTQRKIWLRLLQGGHVPRSFLVQQCHHESGTSQCSGG